MSCRCIGYDRPRIKTESDFKLALGVREPVLSAGKVKSGGVIHLAADCCYLTWWTSREVLHVELRDGYQIIDSAHWEHLYMAFRALCRLVW